MVGTAGLPNLLTRYCTTATVAGARESVAWSLVFICLLYLSAPALAVMVKTEVFNGLVGTSFDQLPAWIRQWQRVDPALLSVVDLNGDGKLQLGELRRGEQGRDQEHRVGPREPHLGELVGNGEEALGPSDAITESTELDEQFWRKHFAHFVAGLVDEAYDAIMGQEAFSLTKERSLLVIRYPFDALLERLCRTPKPLDKTRVQTLFEFETRDFASRKARKLVHDILLGMAARPGYPFAQGDIDFISQIVCIDPAAKEMERMQTLLLSGGMPGPDGETAEAPPAEVNAEQVAHRMIVDFLGELV